MRAARAALNGASPLSENASKLPLFETLVRRAIIAAADQENVKAAIWETSP